MDIHRFAKSLYGGQWLQNVMIKPGIDLGRATNWKSLVSSGKRTH